MVDLSLFPVFQSTVDTYLFHSGHQFLFRVHLFFDWRPVWKISNKNHFTIFFLILIIHFQSLKSWKEQGKKLITYEEPELNFLNLFLFLFYYSTIWNMWLEKDDQLAGKMSRIFWFLPTDWTDCWALTCPSLLWISINVESVPFRPDTISKPSCISPELINVTRHPPYSIALFFLKLNRIESQFKMIIISFIPQCRFERGYGWIRGGYTCTCLSGYYSPFLKNATFNGSNVERKSTYLFLFL